MRPLNALHLSWPSPVWAAPTRKRSGRALGKKLQQEGRGRGEAVMKSQMQNKMQGAAGQLMLMKHQDIYDTSTVHCAVMCAHTCKAIPGQQRGAMIAHGRRMKSGSCSIHIYIYTHEYLSRWWKLVISTDGTLENRSRQDKSLSELLVSKNKT